MLADAFVWISNGSSALPLFSQETVDTIHATLSELRHTLAQQQAVSALAAEPLAPYLSAAAGSGAAASSHPNQMLEPSLPRQLAQAAAQSVRQSENIADVAGRSMALARQIAAVVGAQQPGPRSGSPRKGGSHGVDGQGPKSILHKAEAGAAQGASPRGLFEDDVRDGGKHRPGGQNHDSTSPARKPKPSKNTPNPKLAHFMKQLNRGVQGRGS